MRGTDAGQPEDSLSPPRRAGALLRYALFVTALVAVVFFAGVHTPEAAGRALPDTEPRLASHADALAPHATGRILVKFKKGLISSGIASVHAELKSSPLRKFSVVRNLELVRTAQGQAVETALASFRSHPAVAYAEPDYVLKASGVPSDPYFPYLWALQNTGQEGGKPGADIGAVAAWETTTGSPDVVVAVIDTGVDYEHPDLAANMWQNPLDCNGDGVDDDDNGWADDCHGINVLAETSDPWDDNMHGTHVAGIIGATGNNSLGVTGVNWHVGIMACKFLDAGGGGFASGVIACLDYVKRMKEKGVNVVATNNSYGGFGYSQAFEEAVEAHEQAGVLFVASAGNDNESSDFYTIFPAGFKPSNVISIAAMDRLDGLASYSNYGRQTVHLGAPGSEILSSTTGGAYNVFSGTSMAAPYVTGVAALIKAQDPSRDWKTIKNLLLAGGDPLPSLVNTVTARRLNALGSLTCSGRVVRSRLRPIGRSVIAYAGSPVVLSVLHLNCAGANGEVTVSVEPGGTAVKLKDDGAGPDRVAGDGVYEGLWTPATPGIHTLTFPGDDPVVVKVLQGTSLPFFRSAERCGLEGQGLYALALGDVNGDGRMDLVGTGGDHYYYPYIPNELHVFHQEPSGQLLPPVSSIISDPGTGASVYGLDIGDFNNDGRQDIAVSSSHPQYVEENFVGIFLQNASGGLNPMVRYPTIHGRRLKAGDMNGDGLADVITTGFHDNVVYVDLFYQNPAGTLDHGETREITFDMVHDVSLEIADVNSDGLPDIVVLVHLWGIWTDFPRIAVLYQQGDGSLSEPVFLETGARAFVWDIASGDLNGDGRTDLAFTGGGNRYLYPKPAVDLFIQGADTDLRPSGYYPVSDNPRWVKIVDIDGDGRKDIITAHEYFLNILFQAPNGSFFPPVLFGATPGSSAAIAVGDMNGDGRPDVAMGGGNVGCVSLFYNDNQTKAEDWLLAILLGGNGEGTVTSEPPGISCPPQCEASFPFGTYLTLSAAPKQGSLLAGWRCKYCFFTPEGKAVLPLQRHDAVQVDFNLRSVHLAVDKTGSGSGTVTSHPKGISCGSDCSEDYPSYTWITLTPAPDPDSVFEGWEDSQCWPYLAGSCRISVEAPYTARPRFRLKKVALTVTKEGTGGGKVTSNPSGIDCGATCTGNFPTGTPVALAAEADAGSVFVGWAGACSGTGACSVTMDAAKSLSATFIKPFSIITTLLPEGEVGASYNVTLAIQGGLPPYGAHLSRGVLPYGLALTTGPALSGMPLKAQTVSFSLSITDSLGASVEAQYKVKILKGVAITSRTIPNGRAGRPYKAVLRASGGKIPYTWSLKGGTMPLGISLDPAAGTLSGTPQGPGAFDPVIEVADSLGGRSAKAFAWTVKP